MESWTQLEAFVRTGSDEAFEAVTSNHIDMVYATALRKTGRPDAASEITQSTFILLSTKAGKLKKTGSLGAWLHRSALFKSMEWINEEKQQRERQNQLKDQLVKEDQPDHWASIEPFLDEAVDALRESDRQLILKRFFQKTSLRALGISLGISEDAARKRVARCVEQLRQWFNRKGIRCSAVGLSACLSYASTQAAPAVLMPSIIKSLLTIQNVSTISAPSFIHSLLLMKTKTILISSLGVVVVTGLLLLNRDDSTSEPVSKPETTTPSELETRMENTGTATAPIMERVEQLQSSRSETQGDPDLLAQFQKLLFSDQHITAGVKDPARAFLEQIPVAERLPYWGMVKEALDASSINVRVRATKLLPLMWPQHVEALPNLYERLSSKDSVSGELIGATYYALGQIIKEPAQFNEVFQAAMKGSELVRKEMAIQTPILISGIQGDKGLITDGIKMQLQSPQKADRILAAQVLAQTREPLAEGIVDILTHSLFDVPDSNNDQTRFNLSLLWKLGPEAESAVPLLLDLADQHPELGELVDMTLKKIRPDELAGFGIQTPLPQLDAKAQSLANELRQNPNQLKDLIQSIESGQSTLSEALAIGTMGPEASPALPALQARLKAAFESNPQEAMILGAVIERLQPEQPKPVLTAMDLIPVLQVLDFSFASGVELEALQNSLKNWSQALMESRILMKENLPHYAEQLKGIHPDLYLQFKTEMLKQDSRWKSVLE